jgi:hypothetical protein
MLFDGKLAGLYGSETDARAFNSLSVDKQNALLLIAHRLEELEIWTAVRSVQNVYGEGGVGMNFAAWPFLLSLLNRRRDFTSWFARHSDTSGGFLERRATHASLHFLFIDGEPRHWAVHFDLYNPWTSPGNAWRHLLVEKIRKETPGWSKIGASLGFKVDNTGRRLGGPDLIL